MRFAERMILSRRKKLALPGFAKGSAYKRDEKEICYDLCSEPFDRRTPEPWLHLVRGHRGGVEIRNHGRKDACLYEGKTRSRNRTLVGALAMLRNILLFTHKEQEKQAARSGFVEEISADHHKAFSRLMRRY